MVGAAIEKLCELQYEESQNCCLTDGEMSPTAEDVGGSDIMMAGCHGRRQQHHHPQCHADKNAMVRAARCLLAAVTQVLLLADTVVVKQLLQAKDKVGDEPLILIYTWPARRPGFVYQVKVLSILYSPSSCVMMSRVSPRIDPDQDPVSLYI